jgi:hypothetical protein|tara:strand:+ start:785 stop:952 length:168 start_codon:yes stop_codon:yes gene_type:complete
MKSYKIEYRYLAFGGQDLEGYDYDIVNVKAISPSQALRLAKNEAPFNAKDFQILN